MLGHSEIDIEISDASIETTESNNYRRVSRDDENTNDILAMMQERARFFHKDGWKFINPFTQSISGLC